MNKANTTKQVNAIEQVNELVYQIIKKEYNKITPNEKQLIANNIKSINWNKYATYDMSLLIDCIVKTCVEQINTLRQSIDIKELLIKQDALMNKPTNLSNQSSLNSPTTNSPGLASLNIQSFNDIRNSNKFVSDLIPQYYKKYIVFDSFMVNETDGYYFSWNFGANKDIKQGSVTCNDGLDNIIAMRIYQPNISSIIYNPIGANMGVEFPSYANSIIDSNRIAILIKELSSQAFTLTDTVRYHWMLQLITSASTTNSTGNFFELQTENSNEGIYKFVKPIKNVDSFTFTFTSPSDPIKMYPSRYLCTFTYGATTTIHLQNAFADAPLVNSTGGNPQNTNLYFYDFNTANPLADAITIANMNNPLGLQITFVDYQTITVAINTTTITPIVGLTINVYLAIYRFIIPIEFTHLRETD